MNRARFFPCGLALLTVLLLTGGCASMRDESPWLIRNSVAELQANPSLMQDALLQDTNLDGLRLENVTLRNTAFIRTTGRGVSLKNVTFENCRFINAVFTGAVLENVTFKGGLLTCGDDADNIAKRTAFIASVFRNVTFDGTSLENARLDLRDSALTLRNLHSVGNQEPLITGVNIQLTLDAAILRYMTIAEVSGASTLTARRCTFEYAGFGNSRFASATFANCVTYGPPAYAGAPASGPERRGARR